MFLGEVFIDQNAEKFVLLFSAIVLRPTITQY